MSPNAKFQQGICEAEEEFTDVSNLSSSPLTMPFPSRPAKHRNVKTYLKAAVAIIGVVCVSLGIVSLVKPGAENYNSAIDTSARRGLSFRSASPGLSQYSSEDSLTPSKSARRLGGAPSMQCMGYSPFHHAKYPSDVSGVLDDDLSRISQHFPCVRTFYSQYYGINSAQKIVDHGMKVVLGVYLNGDFTQAEIDNAIWACNNLGGSILAIIVGSEDIAPAGSRSAWDIENAVNKIRAGGCSRPIGTSQRINEYLDDNVNWGNLLNSLDFLGVTIYPFFSQLADKNNPMQMMYSQMGQLQQKKGSVFYKFRVTETGWPTSGSSYYGNAPSIANAKRYFDQVAAAACDGYFQDWISYYIFHDEKTPQSPDVNQFFGLAYDHGGLKFDLSSARCTPKGDEPVPPPTTTTTTAPPAPKPTTTTATPPSVPCNNIEWNVDYVGNDVGSAKSGSAEGCCGHCQAKSGCGAFTWTNYNGGTCWLKSHKGTAKYSKGAASAVFGSSTTPAPPTTAPPAPPSSCGDLESNVDYIGNDVGSAKSGSAGGCCALCQAKSGCGAFTWTSYNGGTCWLKSHKGSTKYAAGAVSRSFGGSTPAPPAPPSPPSPPPSSSCAALDQNVDYIGNDVGAVASGSAQNCCSICADFSGCGAFTWTNFKGGMCWLKSHKGSTAHLSGAVSGLPSKSAPPSPSPPSPPPSCDSFEENVDYVGEDVGYAEASKPSDCCVLCAQKNGCGAFTWTNYLGGVCWLKAKKGGTKGLQGAYSGVVSGSLPPPVTSAPSEDDGNNDSGNIQENTDFVGNDVGYAEAANAEACVSVCQSRENCGAFTWTNYNGGTCWLKSQKGATAHLSGARSAVVNKNNNNYDNNNQNDNVGGWCKTWDMAQAKPQWYGGNNAAVDIPVQADGSVVLSTSSGGWGCPTGDNGCPDVHIKQPFSGRKALYMEAEFLTPSSFGSIWVLHEGTTSNGATQFGKNPWPASGEIDVFETLEDYSDVSDRYSSVYPAVMQQCAARHNAWPIMRTSFPRDNLRYLLIVDQLPEGGQYLQIVYNPDKNLMENSCIDIEAVRKWGNLNSSESKLLLKNDAKSFWGSKNMPTGKSCRTETILPPEYNVNGPYGQNHNCGWPFFEGFNIHAKASGGQMKIKTLQVFQPSDPNTCYN